MNEKKAKVMAQVRARKIEKVREDAAAFAEAGVTPVVLASLEPIKQELEASMRTAVLRGVFVANVALGLLSGLAMLILLG